MSPRTTALLVRLTPAERAELERVRREMGARSMSEAVRRVVELWDDCAHKTTKARPKPGESSAG